MFLNKIFTFTFWLLLLIFLNFIPPANTFAIVAFLLLTFCAVFSTSRLFINSFKIAGLLAIITVSLLTFRL